MPALLESNRVFPVLLIDQDKQRNAPYEESQQHQPENQQRAKRFNLDCHGDCDTDAAAHRSEYWSTGSISPKNPAFRASPDCGGCGFFTITLKYRQALLDILDLFTHLFDQHLEVYRELCGQTILGFGAQGIDLSI